jgi:hypothetical protein
MARIEQWLNMPGLVIDARTVIQLMEIAVRASARQIFKFGGAAGATRQDVIKYKSTDLEFARQPTVFAAAARSFDNSRSQCRRHAS